MPSFIAQFSAGPQHFSAVNMTDAVEQATTLGRALYGKGPRAEPISIRLKGPEHALPDSAGRLPRAVRQLLAEATKSADRQRCGVSPQAQEEMRLYLDTWVTRRLREVLRWSDGEISTAELDNNNNSFLDFN